MSSLPATLPQISRKRRILFLLIFLFVTYLILEAVASLYVWFAHSDATLFLFEEPARTWQFDAVRGYRLTGTPSRCARISNGLTEFITTIRGNAQGFPDWDDFGPKRDPRFARRYAVFGDSMTAGLCLGQNWPDRAETLTRANGKPIQLLNFAVSAGGLPNWWSVLTKFVGPENYDLDGVIFAVYVDDLSRGFVILDQEGQTKFMMGVARSRDPKTYPANLTEAQPLLSHVHLENAYNVSGEEFEQALQGKWPASVPHPGFRLVLLNRAWDLLSRIKSRSEESWWDDSEPEIRSDLIEDIGRFVKARRLPALVVYIPDREHLLRPDSAPQRPLEETKAFAAKLGATFVDSSQMFAQMSAAEIRALFFRYDGHLNQAGSNRLAEFITEHLSILERAN